MWAAPDLTCTINGASEVSATGALEPLAGDDHEERQAEDHDGDHGDEHLGLNADDWIFEAAGCMALLDFLFL